MAESQLIDIEVAYAAPDDQVIVPLEVPAGTDAAEAVRLSGLLERFPDIDADNLSVGVFGVHVSPRALLSQGDRLEIYRPLQVDPKEARRNRAARARRGR
jgi:uncharacterized protein